MGGEGAVAQPDPGDRATALFCLTPQEIGKLINRRVGAALRRLGDLLDRGGRLLRSRVRQTEASTQPTSRLMRSRWAPVQAPRTHGPVTPPQAHRPFSRSRGVYCRVLRLDDQVLRIIPARAGFTRLAWHTCRVVPDHPRSRGVYESSTSELTQDGGSSPLARGLPSNLISCQPLQRIIPARAGFTRCVGLSRGGCGDHPRSRGVYPNIAKDIKFCKGSSPLARGLLRFHEPGDRRERIIPARAEFTSVFSSAIPLLRDHPRSRGVYPDAARETASTSGSSPLARGLLIPHARADPERIIPARAGFTLFGRASYSNGSDHPRSRGVYVANRSPSTPCSGSSPLARGLHVDGCVQPVYIGIIPARAGFTRLIKPSDFH